MTPALDRLLLHLETVRAGWLRGAPVRASELDLQIEELVRLLEGAAPADVERGQAVVLRLTDGIGLARVRANGEIAAIPGRRRAVRGQACLHADPGVRLRRRA